MWSRCLVVLTVLEAYSTHTPRLTPPHPSTHTRLIPPHPFRSLLEAEGYAVFGLTGAEDGELYRDAVVRMYIPAMPLPYHCFSRVSPPIRLMDRTVRSIRSTRSV